MGIGDLPSNRSSPSVNPVPDGLSFSHRCVLPFPTPWLLSSHFFLSLAVLIPPRFASLHSLLLLTPLPRLRHPPPSPTMSGHPFIQPQKVKIIIAGAGICGLMTAIQLERAGMEYTVFEKAKECLPLGSALSLTPACGYIFDQLGQVFILSLSLSLSLSSHSCPTCNTNVSRCSASPGSLCSMNNE